MKRKHKYQSFLYVCMYYVYSIVIYLFCHCVFNLKHHRMGGPDSNEFILKS